MVPAVITRDTTGSVAVLTMSSTCPVTVCRPPRLRPLFWNTVCLLLLPRLFFAVMTNFFFADMVAEAAVVGVADELTGQAVNAFVSLKEGNETSEQVRKDLVMQVRKSIGPFAAPKAVFTVDDLPKTRSGKIMRRILRKILSGEEDSLGDITTVSIYFHSLGGRIEFWLTWFPAVGPLGGCEDHQHGPRGPWQINGQWDEPHLVNDNLEMRKKKTKIKKDKKKPGKP